MDKSTSIKRHATRRFLERTGVTLTREMANEIVKEIQTGKLKCLKRESNRVSVWLYTVNDKDYKLYYDSDRHLIITIYPINSWLREWVSGRINIV